jgi:hypothetical protein
VQGVAVLWLRGGDARHQGACGGRGTASQAAGQWEDLQAVAPEGPTGWADRVHRGRGFMVED